MVDPFINLKSYSSNSQSLITKLTRRYNFPLLLMHMNALITDALSHDNPMLTSVYYSVLLSPTCLHQLPRLSLVSISVQKRGQEARELRLRHQRRRAGIKWGQWWPKCRSRSGSWLFMKASTDTHDYLRARRRDANGAQRKVYTCEKSLKDSLTGVCASDATPAAEPAAPGEVSAAVTAGRAVASYCSA